MVNIAQNPFRSRFRESDLADRLRASYPSFAEVADSLAVFEGEASTDVADDVAATIPQNRAGKRATAAADRRSTNPRPTPRKNLSQAELRKRQHDRKWDTAYRADLDKRAARWIRPEPPVKVDGSGKAWRACPREVWRMAQDVGSTWSANAWRYWARRCPNKPALGALRRAALLPGPDGRCKRTFASERARRIAALGLAMLAFGRHTARKGPWQHVVRGIPVALMQELLTYPDGSRRPSVNAIIGHHRGLGSDHARGQTGYLRALEAAGFMHRAQQCYPDAADWEQGKIVTMANGRTFRSQINRYWLLGNPPMKATRPELLELEREGWRSLDEPVSVPRRAKRTEPAAPAPS